MNSYSYIHTTEGKNDECYTERYAVEPLLKYLEPYRDKIIWCPFDTKESEFVKVFTEYGYKVTYSHISTGQDYFRYEPAEWDLIISNPPFSGKKRIFERALSFNKPFCLLLPITSLEGIERGKIFREKGIQLLVFDRRCNFIYDNAKKNNWFNTSWFCWKILPKQLIFEELNKVGEIDD